MSTQKKSSTNREENMSMPKQTLNSVRPIEEEKVKRMTEMFKLELAMAVDNDSKPLTTVVDFVAYTLGTKYRVV